MFECDEVFALFVRAAVEMNVDVTQLAKQRCEHVAREIVLAHGLEEIQRLVDFFHIPLAACACR